MFVCCWGECLTVCGEIYLEILAPRDHLESQFRSIKLNGNPYMTVYENCSINGIEPRDLGSLVCASHIAYMICSSQKQFSKN